MAGGDPTRQGRSPSSDQTGVQLKTDWSLARMRIRRVQRPDIPQIARLCYETVHRVNARDYGLADRPSRPLAWPRTLGGRSVVTTVL